MPISRHEAQQALQDVASTEDRARRWTLFKGPDALYMIWGAVWVIAFTAQQFLPRSTLNLGWFSVQPMSSTVWFVLLPAGIFASLAVARRRTTVRSPEGRRTGILWGALFGYFYLWMFLLWPFLDLDPARSLERERTFTAVISTVPMLAYLVMGLSGCGNYMIWLGLGVTVLTVAGLFLVPAWFFLWMALLGGGALFLAGVLARRQWRKA